MISVDDPSPRTALRICPLCESTCGLTLTLKADRVLRTTGDEADVFSDGFMCPKGATLGELHDDPDWLQHPVIRDGDRFVEATWDEAFARVGELVEGVTRRHGRSAMAVYFGNPIGHNLSGLLYPRVFLKALGTPNLYTASSLDGRPKDLSNGLLYGDRNTLAVPDIDRTDFLVIIGANPMESNGSLTTAAGWPRRLDALQQRGGEYIVIDPVRTRTAERSDQHLRPRVGSDAALLCSMVHVLFDENLADPGSAAQFVKNVERVRHAVGDFAPEEVETFVGLPAATIRDLVRRLAGARRAAVYGRMGTTATKFGSIASWMVDVLNILTGNLDRVGGAMFPNPASGSANTQGRPRFGPPPRMGRFHTRVRNAPEQFGELPTSFLAEEIDTPGVGRYHGLLMISGNPVVSSPDSDRMDRALSTLDALVAIDPYVNDSTRHAHVILPPPSPLQRSHFDIHFAMWSVRNTARYSPATIPRRAGQLEEWEIMCRLASVFEGRNSTVEEIDERLIRSLIEAEARYEGSSIAGADTDEVLAALAPRRGPERILDFRLRVGPYGDGFGQGAGTLSLTELEQHPHGIDFGPLQPRLPDVLRTPTGSIDLAPELLVEDLARLRDAVVQVEPGGLVLIGRRHLRSNNSWMHNVPSLMTGVDRSRLQMHPDDAQQRGLDQGALARITSETGALDVRVEHTDRLPRGVVSLPHGWRHGSGTVSLSTAMARPGVNCNRIIGVDVDVPSANAAFNGVAVEVARAP